jgi:hypothetical protein
LRMITLVLMFAFMRSLDFASYVSSKAAEEENGEKHFHCNVHLFGTKVLALSM